MAQLSAAIDGIAEACTALGTPVTGGNVSLYNETRGEGIYPTPVIGIVGILDDVSKAVPSCFQRSGQSVYLLSAIDGVGRNAQQDMGSTDNARVTNGELWGGLQPLNFAKEAALQRAFAALAMEWPDRFCLARDISRWRLLCYLRKGWVSAQPRHTNSI